MRLKLIYAVMGSFLLIGDLFIAMLPKNILLISVPQAIAAGSSEISLSKAFPHKKRSLAQFPAKANGKATRNKRSNYRPGFCQYLFCSANCGRRSWTTGKAG